MHFNFTRSGVDDNLSGTLFNTLATGGTLALVDGSHVICHVDGIKFTDTDTEGTADTASLTGLADSKCLVLRVTVHSHSGGVRHSSNEVLRTCGGTSHTANTGFTVYHSNAIFNMDGIEGTGGHTATKAHTAIVTALRATATY